MHNKKIIIGLAVLILAGIVLAFVHYKLGFLTKYNSYTAKQDIEKGDIRILIYGELLPNEAMENKIAKTFGFRFDRVKDCTINQTFINGVNRYNNTVKHYLAGKYGRDWETLFNERLSQEMKKVP